LQQQVLGGVTDLDQHVTLGTRPVLDRHPLRHAGDDHHGRCRLERTLVKRRRGQLRPHIDVGFERDLVPGGPVVTDTARMDNIDLERVQAPRRGRRPTVRPLALRRPEQLAKLSIRELAIGKPTDRSAEKDRLLQRLVTSVGGSGSPTTGTTTGGATARSRLPPEISTAAHAAVPKASTAEPKAATATWCARSDPRMNAP